MTPVEASYDGGVISRQCLKGSMPAPDTLNLPGNGHTAGHEFAAPSHRV